MRVAYVSVDPGVPIFGNKGASVHAQAVLRSLLRRGAEVHLVTTRPAGPPPPDLTEVRVHPLPAGRGADPASRERALQLADGQVRSVLDDVASVDDLDLVYERYSLWGRAATAWTRANHVSSVLEVNAPLVEEQARHRVLIDRRGARRVAREALGAAGTIVCVSDTVSRWAVAQGAPAERVFTVANGVDTTRILPGRTEPVGPFTIGFVGTLKPWHGVSDLVRAFALLRNAGGDHRLLLVGDGPERQRVQALARSFGVLDGIELTGIVPPDRVPALLRRMHVAVAPYPAMADFYFSPLKLFEYLAAGLPVVASSVGSVPEALGDGAHGVLVPPGSPDALAAAIAALEADPARRAALRRAARAAAADHDWEAVVQRILTLAGVVDATV